MADIAPRPLPSLPPLFERGGGGGGGGRKGGTGRAHIGGEQLGQDAKLENTHAGGTKPKYFELIVEVFAKISAIKDKSALLFLKRKLSLWKAEICGPPPPFSAPPPPPPTFQSTCILLRQRRRRKRWGKMPSPSSFGRSFDEVRCYIRRRRRKDPRTYVGTALIPYVRHCKGEEAMKKVFQRL